MSRPIVYQTQYNPNIDTRDALRYGELELLFERPGEPAVAPTRMIDELWRRLWCFTAQDYLLPTGSPALIGAATAIASRQAGGAVNMLLWDRKTRSYMETTLSMRTNQSVYGGQQSDE